MEDTIGSYMSNVSNVAMLCATCRLHTKRAQIGI
jgi:hypothetical protein